MNKRTKKLESGITSIALVITIIILLILAGILMVQLTRNGVLEKAELAKEKTENAEIEEDNTLNDYSNKIGKYTNEVKNFLNDSTIIGDFTPITSSDSGNIINVKVNIEDSQDIRGYIYMINDEVKKVSEDKEVQITGLINNTTYKVTVIAIDKYAGTKISQEVEQKTLNEITIFKDGILNDEYPLTKYLPNSNAHAEIRDNRYFLAASYGDNYSLLYLTNSIDFSNVKSVKVNVAIKTDGGGITSTFTAGLQTEITKNLSYDENLKVSKSTTSTTEQNYEIILDTSDVSGNKYLKMNVYHSPGNAYTAVAYISSITLIYD